MTDCRLHQMSLRNCRARRRIPLFTILPSFTLTRYIETLPIPSTLCIRAKSSRNIFSSHVTPKYNRVASTDRRLVGVVRQPRVSNDRLLHVT